MGDFLRKNACTPDTQLYLAAGVTCELSTNSTAIHAAARQSFFLSDDSRECPDFFLKLWVDQQIRGVQPWPKPYVRGLDHLVYLGFDAGSSIAVNLIAKSVIGRVSPQFADDGDYWKRVVFPMLLSVIAGAAGVVELHCACVASGGDGMLLAGPSGSGKSTLAVALARMSFGFLSDDRTFCSDQGGELAAWGLLSDLKLRPEAGKWFPELKGPSSSKAEEGKPEIRLLPENLSGVQRTRRCKPRCLVFLERSDAEAFLVRTISKEEATQRLESDLMAEVPETRARQSAVIVRLVGLPRALLRYGGSPWSVAAKLAEYFEEIRRTATNPTAFPLPSDSSHFSFKS